MIYGQRVPTDKGSLAGLRAEELRQTNVGDIARPTTAPA
jgi:hypothetical protein